MSFTINKQIVLDLFFEHYRTMLTNRELDTFTDGEVIFYSDVCINGNNIFDIACKIIGIELTDKNFDLFYSPFLEIINNENLENSDEVKKEIEKFYNAISKG